MNEGESVAVSVAQIESKIFLILGQKVMLSPHLAELCEVEPRALNQTVKRNPERFSADFMFQPKAEEFARFKEVFEASTIPGVWTQSSNRQQ